ncbi:MULTISPECIES: hypothetical protein [Salimicrobium]|uniref:Uncharacterized protein n=1 Tax=Salimicrobium humidisoli TaxID=2029857 RepID=A0ABX4HP18_9BACI|nr:MULTISPECIES: hypothetical protein [Salimicrobium]PBB04650.1 hypothetical protein CKW00_12940 [Salimicrobium humidisoli]
MPHIANPQTSMKRARVKKSLRVERQELHQKKLDAIASTIDMNKLPDQETLPVDTFGRVDIAPDHPDYAYWAKDED